MKFSLKNMNQANRTSDTAQTILDNFSRMNTCRYALAYKTADGGRA
ncbi:hypothetical protein [Moraxella caviae]|nr:hypothetical protein [Moraxella caviae]